MRKTILWLTLFATVVGGRAVDAPAENIALGKKYRLEPAPNYPYCTDARDDVQLTDGQKVSGHFWTQSGTVGWANQAPVVITIDLQTNQPIAGLSYSTAASGGAGVSWPTAIYIWVSDDEQVWHVAGDLVEAGAKQALAPALSDYALHRFQTRALATHGRFVKLIIVPTETYTFRARFFATATCTRPGCDGSPEVLRRDPDGLVRPTPAHRRSGGDAGQVEDVAMRRKTTGETRRGTGFHCHEDSVHACRFSG
jgi:hypothetical protein